MTFEDLAAKYHWIEYNPETGEVDVFLDHHAMQSYRACESYFDLNILQNQQLKGGHSWSLSFGIVFHSVMEYIYKNKLVNFEGTFNVVEEAHKLWLQHNMHERFSEHKSYKALGGFEGFMGIIAQYSHYYNQDIERLRPIAIEVPFGKAKEVYLGQFIIQKPDRELERFFTSCIVEQKIVNCYLTGRIDFLMDSGTTIGPMDHKTTAFFGGKNPMNTYEIQEGMTGYIFATNQIIKSMFPELAAKRSTNTMWINFIQIQNEVDPQKRFKRLPLMKTPWQLEQYRLRQVSTIRNIIDMLIEERTPTWSTDRCANFYHSECVYKAVHRQGSESSMFSILESDYKQEKVWDPENMED
jgi:hypothetical protein